MSVHTSVFGLAVMMTTVVGATEPIEMQVSPALSFAPANLVIRTRVEPDASNRAMEVVADSEGFYRARAQFSSRAIVRRGRPRSSSEAFYRVTTK